MTLGRIIRAVNAPHLSLIKPTRLTKTFVLGDVAVRLLLSYHLSQGIKVQIVVLTTR